MSRYHHYQQIYQRYQQIYQRYQIVSDSIRVHPRKSVVYISPIRMIRIIAFFVL